MAKTYTTTDLKAHTKTYTLTSESVGAGHPDKICDQISDTVLDALLALDPHARVAADAWVKDNAVGLIGEITAKKQAEYEKIIRQTLKKIGYTHESWGINPDTCAIHLQLSEQSPQIAQGVDANAQKEQGAGDQGHMWGYACDETPEFLPLPTVLSHKLLAQLARVRESDTRIRPDAKSQVSVRYVDGKPAAVTAVVLAIQHAPELKRAELEKIAREKVIVPVLGALFTQETKIIVNGTGTFEIGGPKGDSGLTGRKIIVDTYGGIGRHGGGAFSGKDPSKVDRSAAYAARYIAKNIVAAKIAPVCEVQLSYCIGVAEPTSLQINTFGVADDEKLENAVRVLFPLKPGQIISYFSLLKPKGWSYAQTAVYGHFGREQFPWEKVDKAGHVAELYHK